MSANGLPTEPGMYLWVSPVETSFVNVNRDEDGNLYPDAKADCFDYYQNGTWEPIDPKQILSWKADSERVEAVVHAAEEVLWTAQEIPAETGDEMATKCAILDEALSRAKSARNVDGPKPEATCPSLQVESVPVEKLREVVAQVRAIGRMPLSQHRGSYRDHFNEAADMLEALLPREGA